MAGTFRYMLVYTEGLVDGVTIVWDEDTERFKAATYNGNVPPGGIPGGTAGSGEVPENVITAIQEAIVELQNTADTTSGELDTIQNALAGSGYAKALLKTTSQWTSLNPVVELGTLAIEQKSNNTVSVRLGNGIAVWSVLPELGTGGGGPATATDFVGGALVTELSATTDFIGGASVTSF